MWGPLKVRPPTLPPPPHKRGMIFLKDGCNGGMGNFCLKWRVGEVGMGWVGFVMGEMEIFKVT